jgi:hypothetical protein
MRLGLLCAAVLISACVANAPKPDVGTAPNPITGNAIATTSLDAPPGDAPAVIPAPIASPAELACIRSAGLWANAGQSGAKTCVKPTRDAGKSCTRQTQCDGLCLARSGTCAPYTPLFGCNDILQADGVRTMLCLE